MQPAAFTAVPPGFLAHGSAYAPRNSPVMSEATPKPLHLAGEETGRQQPRDQPKATQRAQGWGAN